MLFFSVSTWRRVFSILVSCNVLTVPGFQYHILEQAVLMRTFSLLVIGKEDESFL